MDRPETFTCPICGTEFEALVRVSSYQTGQALDLCPIGADYWPKPLVVCPKDHFILYKDEFTDTEISELRIFIEYEEYQNMADSLSDHYLLGQILEYIGADSGEIGYAYLQASWKESYGDSTLYRIYAGKALEYISKEVYTLPYPDYDVIHAKLLCGELERRLGKFEEARNRMNSVKEDVYILTSGLIRLAECQEYLIEAEDTESHEQAVCDTLQ